MLKYFVPLFFSFSSFSQDNIENSTGFNTVNETTVEITGEHKYVSLKDNKVFDIEIIVFAYLNPLPNYETFSNKAIFDDSQALNLNFKPEDLPYIQDQTQDETEIVENSIDINLKSTDKQLGNIKPEFTVPIGDQEDDMHVLAWFEHHKEYYKLTPIWERLLQQQNIVPILHKAWRQTETPFENPTYVKLTNVLSNDPEFSLPPNDNNKIISSDIIPDTNPFETHNQLNGISSISDAKPSYIKNTLSNVNSNASHFNTLQNLMINQDNHAQSDDSSEAKKMLYSDFTVTGMVALSKGRFMHFGHKINLFRLYQDIEHENKIKNMIFSLKERKELDTDELHYFDSPWFGSIVKITEYKGEAYESTEKTIE